ncbi:MAG: DUF512 domain-containing protein [Clostridia bacterium]|nr:DUF512 domain-containing protein [Clostridia bacterium]
MVKITEVVPGSLGERHGVRAGDFLISVNNNPIGDVLDYRFYLTERSVALRLCRDGKEYTVVIRKGEYDDVGLIFETPLMDKKHSCKNGCIFCFIDQNPKGMRESVYFKDDDSRLSFLHGNYVTLTNMTDADVARIVKMRFSPINVSVHTTNPELRVAMMKNKRAGEVLRYLDDFKNAGLSMCGQIVLCRGINDGAELLRTMTDLSRYYPEMSSCSVVPAGLTRFRENLYPLSDFTKEEAAAVVDMIESFAEKMKAGTGSRMFFASDELYLKAGRPLPSADHYEGYPQIENGVGMLTSFEEDYAMAEEDFAEEAKAMTVPRTVTVVTGYAAADLMRSLAGRAEKLSPMIRVNVRAIRNDYFGETVTVSGLLTGKDITAQLCGVPLGDEVLLPRNTLRAEGDKFLCGMTLDEFKEKLNVPVCVTENDGYEFFRAIFGLGN